MNSKILAVFSAIAAVSILATSAYPCSTFSLNPRNARGTVTDPYGGPVAAGYRSVTAESFDWMTGQGYAFILPRGRVTSAFIADGQKGFEWNAPLGSLSFSVVGPGFTVNGINEAGLSVMVMQADPEYAGTSAPGLPPQLPQMSELQWPQYILDVASNVSEAIEASSKVQLAPLFSPLHYLVCDKTGACATFEQKNDELIIHHGDSLPVAALTNSSYESSLKAWEEFSASSARKPPFPEDDSHRRFVELAKLDQVFLGWGDPVAYAFYALSVVHQQDFTQWNTVFDRRESLGKIREIEAHYRSSANPSVKTIRIHSLDFSCKPEVRAVDVQLPSGGDVTRSFQLYREEDQQRLDMYNAGFVSDEIQARLNLYLRTGFDCR